MNVSVKAKLDDVLNGLSDLQKDAVPQAAQQALNRSGQTVLSRTVKEVAADMGLRKQSDLRPLVTITKAAKGNLKVQVTINDKTLGLEYSKQAIVRQTTRGKGKSRRKAFSVTYKGGSIPNAFRVQNYGKLSNVGIFVPDPKGEKTKLGHRAIKRVFLFSTVQEAVHAKVDEIQEAVGSERFEVEFDRALANALSKLRL
jgi:hypothetical protein